VQSHPGRPGRHLPGHPGRRAPGRTLSDQGGRGPQPGKRLRLPGEEPGQHRAPDPVRHVPARFRPALRGGGPGPLSRHGRGQGGVGRPAADAGRQGHAGGHLSSRHHVFFRPRRPGGQAHGDQIGCAGRARPAGGQSGRSVGRVCVFGWENEREREDASGGREGMIPSRTLRTRGTSTRRMVVGGVGWPR